MIKKIVEKELASLARWLVGRFRPFIIGVTGSSGKTTTKYFISELIKDSAGPVLASSGNLNTKIGLSLSILGYSEAPKGAFGWLWLIISSPIKALFTMKFENYLVLEYAVDRPRDMDELVKIARPDIALITNIGAAHIEIFGSQEKIAKEKWRLAQAAKEAVIVNRETLLKVKEFGLEKIKVNLFILPSMKYAKAENVKSLTNKTELDLYIANKKYQTEFKFFGSHNIENLELAVFCAHLISANDEKIKTAVKNLSPLSGRGKRFFGKKDILIVDESYNANPSSMKASLDTLKDINYGRKVAVIGQMAEIGPISKEAHKEIARYAKEVSDFTVGVGDGFRDLSLDMWYEDVSKLIENTDKIIQSEDVVLVKGSRSNELDKFVEYIGRK